MVPSARMRSARGKGAPSVDSPSETNKSILLAWSFPKVASRVNRDAIWRSASHTGVLPKIKPSASLITWRTFDVHFTIPCAPIWRASGVNRMVPRSPVNGF